jgi:methylglutaconyl-CoA hydratase
MTYEFIQLEKTGPVSTLLMNRPDLHNAFNPQFIREMTSAIHELAGDDSVRVVVLTGAGASFSAGGDISWMQASQQYTNDQNLADARGLDAMFEALNSLPKPLIGRINGAALGGGVGLVACCDLAVAVEEARFGFTEVKLGLLPAVIAQYVVPKIGVSHSRALFVSGERFTSERAFEIGLIHAITSAEELDATVKALAQRMLSGGPQAMGAAKRLVAAMWDLERDAAKQYAIEAIAQARTSAEGQEGLAAFLTKRRPQW